MIDSFLCPTTHIFAQSQVLLQAALLSLVVLANACYYFPPLLSPAGGFHLKRTVGFSLLLLVAHTILPAKTVMSLTLRLEGKWCVCVCVAGDWYLIARHTEELISRAAVACTL